MYKTPDYEYEQLSFFSFNATCGMQLDPNNEWIRISRQLPWRAWEAQYAIMFPSGTGNVAKPCRMVIGSMILQLRMGYKDRELVDQIRQNPYYQYFLGLEAFQHEAPFARTLLVEWRKRIDLKFVIKANDLLCDAAPSAFQFRRKKGIASHRGTLLATQICDATVAPQYIRYPQDTSLLNEARVKLEAMIDFFCETYGLPKPRTYRKVAHKDYLAIARAKKPSKERIREASASSNGAENADDESAEGESEVTEADITAFIMTALGLEEYADFDFEAFYANVQERVANGEELTMEEAFPEFYWEFFTNMFQGSEESGYTVDLVVKDNSMMMYWTFQEDLDEDAINEVVESVSTSFESEETMANLKSAMESMSEAYNIDIDDVEMGLEFINGDDSVIYEMIYTYADLEDVEVPETDEEGGSSDSSASSASEAAEEAEAAVEETKAE